MAWMHDAADPKSRGPLRVRKPFLSYALALVVVVAAVGLRWLLDPLMGNSLPLVTLFGAVATAYWLGGLGPAVVAAILGYAACMYLFIPPRQSFATLGNLDGQIGLLAYLFTVAVIIGFGQAMRMAQNNARQGRDVLRVTLRSIGDAVITTDIEARITYMNEVAEALTGWLHEEVLGKPLDLAFRIVHEMTRQSGESPASRAIREGVVVGLASHTLLIRRDGREIPIDDSAAPIKNEEGRVTGCVLIFRDVSSQRQVERHRETQLTEARLLAAIVESSDDAIIGKSLDGTIQSWNAGAERLFGYTAQEAVGRHVSLIIPQDRMQEEDRIIATLKEGKRVDHFETERKRRDGRRIPVSLTISPIHDDSGRVIGASKIARDITERKRMEDDLRQLAASLALADQRKDEFLATLAHELRSPLAPLSNMFEVLKRSEKDPVKAAQARDTIDRQLHHLVRLVDDLLDLNRIAYNRMELRRSEVPLASVIHQAVEASRPLMDSSRHELRVNLPPNPIYVNADPNRLAQVFGNLLNNSAKYTPPGGTISVTAERRGDEAVVTVRDTGSGIPADKLERIFEMFLQLDPSPERAQGGLGIGLTLVKRIVQMHGGAVEARSEGAGRGTEFLVRLPAMKEAPKGATPAQVEENAAPGSRILVVDDNRDSADSLAMLLSLAGHQTFVVNDGVEAVEAAERHRPETILLDVGLPRMNGHDVCRKIREKPWGQDVMIIAMTGWGQDEDRRKTQDAGFDGHLVKPVNYPALLELLRSRVRMHR